MYVINTKTNMDTHFKNINDIIIKEFNDKVELHLSLMNIQAKKSNDVKDMFAFQDSLNSLFMFLITTPNFLFFLKKNFSIINKDLLSRIPIKSMLYDFTISSNVSISSYIKDMNIKEDFVKTEFMPVIVDNSNVKNIISKDLETDETISMLNHNTIELITFLDKNRVIFYLYVVSLNLNKTAIMSFFKTS